MADVVKMCDVIDTCEECPRYGDDCDGSDEKLYTHEEAFGMCDYISRADAVQGEWGHMVADGTDGSHWYEYECSHCGEVVLRPYNYCPNCGAMMVREDGGE